MGAAGLLGSAICCAAYELSLARVLPCTAALLLLANFASVPLMLWLEDAVRPLALEELHRNPQAEPRQRWPYARALS